MFHQKESSFCPQAAHDPHIFLYYSKHYAMEILLHYLVEEKGVRANDLLDYYVEERGQSPQEYWYQLLGGDNMRTWFADWAAHNAADMDYLTREEFRQDDDDVDNDNDDDDVNDQALRGILSLPGAHLQQ